jgi:hypothetical protein
VVEVPTEVLILPGITMEEVEVVVTTEVWLDSDEGSPLETGMVDVVVKTVVDGLTIM